MYINKNEVIALIPARSGSKGIQNKNIVEVCGFPLFSYSIAVAKMCECINRVIVSTDSEEYAKLAIKYGAEIPQLRPKELSNDNSLDIEYIRHMLDIIYEEKGELPEYLVILRPTTPLRCVKEICNAIERIKNNQQCSSVVSVSRGKSCPYKWMRINENGFLISLFEYMQPDDVNLPRQSFPSVYVPNGYVDVIRSKNIIDKNCVYGESAIPLLCDDEVIDIDTIEDTYGLEEKIKEMEIYTFLKEIIN